MKITMKKSFAVIMALVMCVSMLFGLSFTTHAATYIYNWGTRGTAATELSEYAEAFYTKNGVALSGLLALDGSATESDIPSSELYSALHNLMESNHDNVTSYDDTKDLFMYTDCENSGSPSTISSFYSGEAIGPDWDSGSTWNREHVWPNSKGDLAGDGENDIMMLRPASVSENSSRGNKAYGESDGYFNPNAQSGGTYDLRGDVARIILYQYVRWECTNTGSDYNSSSIFGTNGVIESQEMLIDWIKADPVDTWELGRNDAVEAITGTRNVFVDYPELAFGLFDEAVPTDYTSPSGGEDVESTTTVATITFDNTAKRTSYSASAQVWEENGITFTNNKGSGNDVGDYSNPIRIYKNSEVIIAYDFPITKIEFTANSSTYAGYLNTSLTGLGEVSVSGSVVTIVLTEPTTSFSFTHTGAATRFDSITVYADTSSGDNGDSGDSGDTDSGDTTQTTEVNATITFDDTGLVSTETSAQIWSENGVTVTNNKGTSTNAFYTTVTDHTRFYKGNQIVIEYEYPISKIVFTTTGSSYNTLLANSLTSSGLGTVTSSDTTITLELTTPAETITFDHTNNATRVKSMDITALKTSSGGDSTSATITPQSSNNAHGTVELSGKYITATPATGYEVSGYEIISGDATVTQNGNVFTVEATSDVTVQINFVARTQYTVIFSDLGTTSTTNAYSGDTITLPTLSGADYTAVGWVAAQIDGETTDKPTVYNAGDIYPVTANTTLYALYSRTEAGGSGESDVFTKYTGAITEGDYLITYNNYVMNASISSNRFVQTTVTDVGGSITSPDAAIIWTITADGDYWTLYNESTSSYAAGNGTKNQGKLLTSVTDYALWTASGTDTYEFVNKGNAAKSVNANLRQNTTYGFACYATSTGGALTLYKRTETAMTTYYFTDAGDAVVYTVTANANDSSCGTVSVSGTTISATPVTGYAVSGYSITSGTATVIQEGNTFFVTPTSNVVITINFEALPTYTVTFVEDGATVSADSTYSGGQITLPEYSGTLDEYTTFNGWAEAENETEAAKIFAAGSKYYVTANVTLYAQLTVTTPDVGEDADHYFVKVAEGQTDWSGTYLIVYEAGSIAFNGATTDKLDVANNGIGVTITDCKIAATDTNIAVSFVVEKIEGGYTIRSKSGLYFGSESDTNSLLSNATKTYVNTIAVDDDGNAVITGEGGAILRYNITSNQNRFRFYKTASYTDQQPIALYKLDVADITGAQVTVGSDLTMKYYVDVTNIENIGDGDLTMRFSIDGEVIDTVTGTVNGSQYVFDFSDLAPQRMADKIKAEVLYKGALIDVKDDYSIKTNAQNLLTANADNAELCQFIIDMLYYGAAAQQYTNYNTDNLANDGITGASATTPDASWARVLENNSTPDTVYFRAATVWFDSVNKLIIKLSAVTENTKLYVDGTLVEINYDESTNTYSYTTGEILATDFDKVFTFTLYEDGTLIQTLKYSVNSYAYSKQNTTNTNMAELALALFRLGQSAEKL